MPYAWPSTRTTILRRGIAVVVQGPLTTARTNIHDATARPTYGTILQ